ncbi:MULTISPECIES: NADPH-dependent FMN reductase [Lactiplantibacillus]|uniref:NAD(P)H-dependent oxidoreductase n=3 Tax=Lactiplantibacillus pentosus TaxID=1589 RepID=A0AAW8WBJ3_LACPE|nr:MULTISPECIES: NAD(P)H-dependent oxidoreductase [Lactiplantibacillus]AUI77286.1 NADPH-dependent FMN reductase [Lactiplantibacillus pentosus]MBU7462048.1 NAD(P)H-dependent oxidoreductase [Lactiplantibacillus pentosus]MBU7476582.1 NAD(P)H-dependent oxidoreductase [Lactiplantibacillus pentosus]MBU7483218.1 NAD(P)H-dependent oxidoreductase [Lactiplantibacillus sp. 30.2.29]MBU7486660.1 NAD(P)H-dependent oxidoreductase [Lactiplantibacillus pentosus]
MVKIGIILGSTRTQSNGRSLFNYLKRNLDQWQTDEAITTAFLDLAHYQLPFFDESEPPMANPHRQLPANQQQWLDDMAAMDGYIILTPEYNHAMPAGLKNALDFLAFEGLRKPVKLISYSDNMRGGQFGAAALVPVLQRLGMVVLPKPTPVGNVPQTLQTDGQVIPDAPLASRYESGLQRAVGEIAYYTTVLTQHPFLTD